MSNLTPIVIEEILFVTLIKEVSSLTVGLEKDALIYKVFKLSSETPVFNMSIFRADGEELRIKIEFDANYLYVGCEVLVFNGEDDWYICGRHMARGELKNSCVFPLRCTYSEITQTYQRYLLGDAMLLRCELSFCKVAKPQETVGSSEILQGPPCIQNLPICEIKNENRKSESTLADDILSLYDEMILSDIELRIGSEIFTVHKTILSARSPVFKNIITSRMKETTFDCIDITDINPNTLRRLLLFMYTDTTSDLEWKSAMELYFAAHKYQVESLKFKCLAFLKSNIQPSNCCELLLFSDRHKDSDLKQFVQEYIVQLDKDVFGTDEWGAFINNHALLAADTMYFKYAKK